MALRLTYKFSNRRSVRWAMKLLRRNFPDKDRLDLGIAVMKDEDILVQATLRGKTEMHEEIFAQGILAAGKPVEMSEEEFSRAVLEAAESYLGAAALVFPMCRPGERLEAPHGG